MTCGFQCGMVASEGNFDADGGDDDGRVVAVVVEVVIVETCGRMETGPHHRDHHFHSLNAGYAD